MVTRVSVVIIVAHMVPVVNLTGIVPDFCAVDRLYERGQIHEMCMLALEKEVIVEVSSHGSTDKDIKREHEGEPSTL